MAGSGTFDFRFQPFQFVVDMLPLFKYASSTESYSVLEESQNTNVPMGPDHLPDHL